MKISVLYVGSSLLGPLKNAEREINRAHKLKLQIAAHNFGSPLSDLEWERVDKDLAASEIVFVIHVMDGENASRLVKALELHKEAHAAVVVINCMPDLMRRTRLGRLDINALTVSRQNGSQPRSVKAMNALASAASWMGKQARGNKEKTHSHGKYLKLVDRLPQVLRFVPTTGAFTDAKHYLYLFCYFLQPTPKNIESMLLYALKPDT
jgi:hypothetical protein